MNFKTAEPHEHLPLRLTSENEVWEIGFHPVAFGVRIQAGKIEPSRGYAEVYALDYCAGSDQDFSLELFSTVVILMASLPESITSEQVSQLFPTYQIKPINRDPYCWNELRRLSGLANPFPLVCQP